MFYSKSTGGFYTSEIHGDQIPLDAVEITEEEHAALLEGQSSGMIISADAGGNPILANSPPQTANQILILQIADLESTVTDRRIREAVLGIDAGWLKVVNDEIAKLRATLK